MSVRESGISRGATDAKAVEVLIDQDARERSAWESQTRMLPFPTFPLSFDPYTYCRILVCRKWADV